MPPDGIPCASPPLTPDSQEFTSLDPKQEQVGDIDHEK